MSELEKRLECDCNATVCIFKDAQAQLRRYREALENIEQSADGVCADIQELASEALQEQTP